MMIKEMVVEPTLGTELDEPKAMISMKPRAVVPTLTEVKPNFQTAA